jgi:hypothetical protein
MTVSAIFAISAVNYYEKGFLYHIYQDKVNGEKKEQRSDQSNRRNPIKQYRPIDGPAP